MLVKDHMRRIPQWLSRSLRQLGIAGITSIIGGALFALYSGNPASVFVGWLLGIVVVFPILMLVDWLFHSRENQ